MDTPETVTIECIIAFVSCRFYRRFKHMSSDTTEDILICPVLLLLRGGIAKGVLCTSTMSNLLCVSPSEF
jgi:hypothetical protein